MIDYGNILSIYYPNNQWKIIDCYDYDTLQWYDQNKPSKDELDLKWNETVIKFKKNNCEAKAKELISKCDWSVLPDVNLQNKSDFERYRSKLRELIVSPVENPVFPIEPDPIWSK
jgi:hypothetical protein